VADRGHRAQRVEHVLAKGLGQRRLLAGVGRASLGKQRPGAAGKTHAEATIASLAQIVKHVVTRRHRRPVGGEPAFADAGRAEMGQHPGQAL